MTDDKIREQIAYEYYEFGPGKVVTKTVSLSELMDDFRPGELVHELAKELTAAREVVEAAEVLAPIRPITHALRAKERLRKALTNYKKVKGDE